MFLRLDWAERRIQETREWERALTAGEGCWLVFSDWVRLLVFLYPRLARRIQYPRSPEKSFLEPITSLPSLSSMLGFRVCGSGFV